MSTPPTWNMYVDDHLMRKENNHQLKSGAIIGPKGYIWSQSEEFPSFEEAEINSIIKEFNHHGTLASSGLSFGGKTYMDIQHVDRSVIRARIPGSTAGITIVNTWTILVIGIYDQTPEQCSQIVEKLGSHITKKGHR